MHDHRLFTSVGLYMNGNAECLLKGGVKVISDAYSINDMCLRLKPWFIRIYKIHVPKTSKFVATVLGKDRKCVFILIKL